MAERRAFSVAVFARFRGRVLLIKHERLKTWLPVGGEIEAGETPLEAAKRELREETRLAGRFTHVGGVEGTPAGLIGYEEHQAGSKGLHMNFAFVAEVDNDLVVANDEFKEFRWVADAGDVECPPNVRELVRIAQHAGSDAASIASEASASAGGEPAALVATAKAWLDAFNARDLDRLLALYADDAVHTSPKLRAKDPATKGRVTGKAALRAWWKDSFDRLPGLRYEERHLTASGERVFMEYDRLLPNEETLRVAEVLVVRGGVIRESHVFHG